MSCRTCEQSPALPQKPPVNRIDLALNNAMLLLVTQKYLADGEEALTSLWPTIQWARNRWWPESQEKRTRMTMAELLTYLKTSFQIVRKNTQVADPEMKQYFAIIPQPTYVDKIVEAMLRAYKLLYSPFSQAKRMYDLSCCQRECSVGFAKWYVWARVTLNLDSKTALDFACTTLHVKCEALHSAPTSIIITPLWE